MKQPYSIQYAGSETRDGIPIERYRLRDRYSAPQFTLERWFVRGFIHVMMDRFLRLYSGPADGRYNMARWWVYLTPAMRKWRTYIPGGRATHCTYNPDAPDQPDDLRMDAITKGFFRHSYDAVGLRTRAYLLMDILTKQLQSTTESLQWISLGSGTGVVADDYYAALEDEERTRLKITLVDRDESTLAFCRAFLRRHFEDPIAIVSADITSRKDLATVLNAAPWCVDALGLVEYLDDEIAANVSRQVYDALPRGGKFIFSNMSDIRPELNVHRRGVGWPDVIVRGPREIIGFLSTAGIPTDVVRIMLADDEVYYICEVTKR